MQSLVAAAAVPVLPLELRAADRRVGPLRADPQQLLDLPHGFSYRVVSRIGTLMADGFKVPGSHDGMAAFPGEDGRIILVCNHELAPSEQELSAFTGVDQASFDAVRDKLYDAGHGSTPGAGGTTTTIFNPQTGETERQHLSLAGTDTN